MKPYYETKLGKLYHGDCLEILPQLEPVDLVLTDPPYGCDWDTNYSRFTRGTRDKSRVHGDTRPFDPSPLLAFKNVILWGANNYASSLPGGSFLVWDKRNDDGTAFLSDGEVAWWNKGHGIYIKSISGQWARAVSRGLHPTQKPVELFRWCVKKANESGVVLDPYAGSCTTGVVCEQEGLKWIGIEISEEYCEISAKRIERETAQLSISSIAG